MTEAPTLDTARLRLVAWQERHVAPMAAINADPEVMRHFLSTQTEAETRAAIEAWRAGFASRGLGNWAVELKATGECIGFIGLSVPRRALPFSPCVEIGWRLARAHWGRGYATEGALAALRHGFEALGLERIVSFTALQNRRSQAVMRRIGLEDTGQDFDHPALPEGHALRRHGLHAITRAQWAQVPAERVVLLEIDARSVRRITALAVREDQRRFVASNAESLAEALFKPEAWFRAIGVGDQPAGFVMLFDETQRPTPPERPRIALWRFMIDQGWQGRGVGRAVLRQVIERVRARGCFDRLQVSCVPGPGSPEPFYRRAGFEPTGREDEGERILELPF